MIQTKSVTEGKTREKHYLQLSQIEIQYRKCGRGGVWSMHLEGRDRHSSVSSRPAWCTKQVSGQVPKLHSKTLSQKPEK